MTSPCSDLTHDRRRGLETMTPLHITVLLYSAIPVLAAAIGAAAALIREPGPRLRSGFQHLAGGVVFATAALELLPDVREGPAIPVVVGFSLGVLTMLGIRSLGARLQTARGEKPFPTGLVASTAVDLLVDGLVLGIGFVAAARTGVLLTAALGLEILFVSMGLTATLGQRGVGRLPAAAISILLAFLVGLGAILASTVLAGYSTHDLAGVIAFGSVAL